MKLINRLKPRKVPVRTKRQLAFLCDVKLAEKVQKRLFAMDCSLAQLLVASMKQFLEETDKK